MTSINSSGFTYPFHLSLGVWMSVVQQFLSDLFKLLAFLLSIAFVHLHLFLTLIQPPLQRVAPANSSHGWLVGWVLTVLSTQISLHHAITGLTVKSSQTTYYQTVCNHANTQARAPIYGFFPGLPRWASSRKVKPIWILLKQETVSSSGVSWAICKPAPRSRQITMPAPHYSSCFTGRMPCPTNSVKALKANNGIKNLINF